MNDSKCHQRTLCSRSLFFRIFTKPYLGAHLGQNTTQDSKGRLGPSSGASYVLKEYTFFVLARIIHGF